MDINLAFHCWQDSLRILASKEMRIGGNKGVAVNSEALEGEEDGAAAFVAAKGRVVTQLAKRNLVQNAIPIFIELKR
jgi:condensin-2 complex subunit D3